MKFKTADFSNVITDSQLEFLCSLQSQLSWSRQDMLEKATKICGRMIYDENELSKREASNLIQYMLDVKEINR